MNASTRNTIRTEISRIPMPIRNGALKALGMPSTTPVQDIDKLTDWAIDNFTDYDLAISKIKHATPFTTSTAPLDNALSATVQATSAVASRAETTALDALQKVNTVHQDLLKKLDGLSDSIVSTAKFASGIGSRLDKAEHEMGKVAIDDDAVNRAVNKVVADAFAPFKQAVESVGAQEVVADLASIYVTETKSALDVFGVDVRDVKGNPLMVRIWNDPTAPAVNPYHVWTEKVLRHFLLADLNGDNVWLGGEKATGKSTSVEQFCARTGRAFKRINFTKQTQLEDFIGTTGYDPVKGTYFESKDFLTGFAHPSTCILLDEPSNLDPAILAILNGFLEPNSAVSYGNAVRRRANGVLVFCADNTLGNGDDSGRYAGTKAMNSALIDRFSQVVRMDYLPIKDEIDAVMRHTGCTKELATHVLKAVRVARAKVQTADIVEAPSIRSVVAFIKSLKVLPVRDAWEVAVANRQPSESATALDAIFTATIDQTLISNNI
jgi:cobaltochelatase CobS